MDFVTGLPLADGYDSICVIVDRFSKQRHLCPCNATIDAPGFAELFIKEVFRLHGLPRTVTSDRGPQFVAAFWKLLCKRLGITVQLSSPYHPQTDGQTERFNAVMEQYLRCYVNHRQDDWPRWLSLAEFAANNQENESTKMTPFFANSGWNPRITADLTPPNKGDREDTQAGTLAAQMADIHEFARISMVDAQQRYQDQGDKHREPAPRFKAGDMVWFLTKNTRSARPSKKLDHKREGPFEILADPKLNTPYAYRLKFPPGVQVHLVRHISELEPAAIDPYPGQVIAPPPPVQINGDEEWEVEEVLESRIRYGKLQYLVKWTGYDRPDWQDAKMVNGLQAIDIFHRRYPESLGPLPEDED